MPVAATVAQAKPPPARATPIPTSAGVGQEPEKRPSDDDLREKYPPFTPHPPPHTPLQVFSALQRDARPCCSEGPVSAPCRRGPEQKAQAGAR